jgi:TrpR-related protein YerC/YecD
MSILKDKKSKALIEAILDLKSPAEAERFIRDLLTEAEISEFGNRFCAARMLSEKLPYSQIEKETGLSSTTVARVSKWLNSGSNGYKTIIARMQSNHHHLSHPVGKGLSS